MSVLVTLLKIFGGAKIRKSLRELENVGKDDPELQQQLKDMVAANKEAKAMMKKFCAKNPDHDLCKKGYGGKSRITNIKY